MASVLSRPSACASAIASLVALVLAAANPASASRPLVTAVFQPDLGGGSTMPLELGRIHDAGASVVRVVADWGKLEPTRPDPASDAADPENPALHLGGLDAEVNAAVAAGLQPLLDVVGAPNWAQSGSARAGSGPARPDANALGQFARALAARYSGAIAGLPKVRYWQVWNEPNLNANLEPQFVGTRPASPQVYRGLVNAFAGAVKGVDQHNLVVAGGLAPYGIQKRGQPIDNVLSVAPLRFMRDLLCVSGGRHPRRTCAQRTRFDVFSVHPYTWGGPTHSAYSPDDVAIGDLPDVQAVLRAAWRAHTIVASSAPKLWVTEFGWDTNPPDPKALPISVQARWTAEALYRMWRDGVGLVTWFLLRDLPRPSPFQSGLYFAGGDVAADRPKPTLTAFRFPFVALPAASGTVVWGRTPLSSPARVAIQRKDGRRWRTVAVLPADVHGIFQRTLSLRASSGFLRARVLGALDTSLPFGLKPVRDRRISPFGS